MSRNADFTPSRGNYTSLTPFRYWCQKVLPLVYDDSLSYYELLCKVVDYLNKTMEDTETLNDDVTNLYTAYQQLQQWVNDYYESEDFEQAIDEGLDRMAEDGRLNALMIPLIDSNLPELVYNMLPDTVASQLPDEVSSQIGGTVANQLPNVVSNQIGGTVANQLPNVVSNQIGGVVENQLPNVVSDQINDVVAEEIVNPVEDWLETNVGTGNAIDRTLSIIGAAADAGFTGARLGTLDNVVGYEHVADTGFIITTANPYAFNFEFINDLADFSDLGTHTYKMIVIPVNTGDKYCINAHKISIANVSTNHFAVTYAFCAKHIGDPQTEEPRYLTTTYSKNDAENVIVTAPEIVIPTGQGYDETTGYLVVITANIEDPVYKVDGAVIPALSERIDAVEDSVEELGDSVEALGDSVEEQLNGKADIDGTYEDMTVGLAMDLVSSDTITDNAPYLLRPTAGGKSVVNREYDEIVGGSVVVNQLVDSNDTAVTLANGRKYYTVIGGTETIQGGTGTPIVVTGGTDMVIDLTQMFGSTIADYAYTLEQTTAGAGVAWLKSYGFFSDDYIAYNVGTLAHVSGLSAHVMRDADNNVIGNYPLDSSLTLKGKVRLDNGQMYYDGDTYAPDGTVTRNWREIDLGTLNWSRSADSPEGGNIWVASVSGKALERFMMVCEKYIVAPTATIPAALGNLEMIGRTNNTNLYIRDDQYTTAGAFKTAVTGVPLVYKVSAPTTETAAPYQSPQICNPDGTEEYVTTGIPVGHNTQYPVGLKSELDRIISAVPPAPTTAGVYTLQCTVTNEDVTYEWKANT